MIRVIFFGTSSFAVPALEQLCGLDDVSVVLVVTKPDEPQGRRAVITATPVKKCAGSLGLPIIAPERLKEAVETLRNLKPEVGIIAAYGKILPEIVWKIPTHGCLNIHPSLLPRHRGPSPLQATIASGDQNAGVTIIKLDAEMDHGPLVAQEIVPLHGDEWYEDLKKQLAVQGANMLQNILADYVHGKIALREQDHTQATFCKKLTRADGKINWDAESAEAVERKLRAYSPWPGIWTEWKRKKGAMRIKIINGNVARGFTCLPARQVPRTHVRSGGVQDPALHLSCHDGFFKISLLQPEGSEIMTALQFVNGHPDAVGSFFT